MIAGERRRIRQRATATLTFTPTDADGEPSTSDPGTVTIGIVSSDGTVVVAAGTATTAAGVSRTYALTAVHTANLDILTATWTANATTIGTTSVDIVGGYYFTTAELRAGEPSTRAESKYSDAEIIAARNDVEVCFERWQNVAWVPRLSTYRRPLDNLWTFTLPQPYLRVVRWARIWTSPTDYTALTTAECAAIPADDAGTLYLPYPVWSMYGLQVGYEHGNDAPPFDVKRAAMRYCRVLLNSPLEPSRSQPFVSDVGLLAPARTGTLAGRPDMTRSTK
jgi:hypothetical protein